MINRQDRQEGQDRTDRQDIRTDIQDRHKARQTYSHSRRKTNAKIIKITQRLSARFAEISLNILIAAIL